jgi:hypothetical protein
VTDGFFASHSVLSLAWHTELVNNTIQV